jgi:hypothetical protein
LENCTGSRLEFEDGTISSNSNTSNPSYRTRLISTNYSHCMENCTGTEADDIMCEPCDHTTDTISRSTNVSLSTVSQDRTRPLLNNSGNCLEKCTVSRLEFEDGTTSANSTSSNPSYRTRSISTHYSHVWRRILTESFGVEGDRLSVSFKLSPTAEEPGW